MIVSGNDNEGFIIVSDLSGEYLLVKGYGNCQHIDTKLPFSSIVVESEIATTTLEYFVLKLDLSSIGISSSSHNWCDSTTRFKIVDDLIIYSVHYDALEKIAKHSAIANTFLRLLEV